MYGNHLKSQLGKARLLLSNKEYDDSICMYQNLTNGAEDVNSINRVLNHIEDTIGMVCSNNTPSDYLEKICGLKKELEERLIKKDLELNKMQEDATGSNSNSNGDICAQSGKLN